MKPINRPSTCTSHSVFQRSKMNEPNNYRMNTRQNGFTMVELITVIAIIGITMAIAFISISSIQKNMQQKELDDTAKEIYIAAQNHLSTAQAKGLLNRSGLDFGELAVATTPGEPEEGTTPGEPEAGTDTEYYFVVGNGDAEGRQNKSSLNREGSSYTSSVLYQMLPPGSIDDSIRLNGTYIIKYDKSTATILGVFYARTNNSSWLTASASNFNFTTADYSTLFSNYTGEDHALARQSYSNNSGQTTIIGWYDGDNLEKSDVILQAPILEVQNEERLTAIIEDKNPTVTNKTINLNIEGETSNAYCSIPIYKNGNKVINGTDKPAVNPSSKTNTYFVDLDDITTTNDHFADYFESLGFIPGENLLIQAVSFSNGAIANVAESGKICRNSLFASLVAKRTADGKVEKQTVDGRQVTVYEKAKISNIRHLENLSSEVSNFNPLSTRAITDPETKKAWNGTGPKTAVQTSDVSWTAFQDAIKNPTRTTNGSDVKVVPRKNVTAQASLNAAAGSFLPIVPASGLELTYEGKVTSNGDSHRILNVAIDATSGDVGLFGKANDKLTVSGLVLVNFNVKTAAGNAGALLGSSTNTTDITDVIARNEKGAEIPASPTSTSYGRSNSETELEIAGASSGNAGGLVGTMKDGKIENSAAALYVRSTGSGTAGGLLGLATGNVTIQQSYAGGHTDPSSNHVRYGGFTDDIDTGDTRAYGAGRVNVIATGGSAGGLVGGVQSSENPVLTVTKCYSTASVYGSTSAGGLVGAMGNGGISYSYAAGLMTAPADETNIEQGSRRKGYFIGSQVGSTSSSVANSEYVEILNNPSDMNNIGLSGSDITIADANIGNYRIFAPSTTNAFPYDTWLNTHYRGIYPFRTVADLVKLANASADTSSLPPHLSKHYGDWPALETFVINTSNGTSNG